MPRVRKTQANEMQAGLFDLSPFLKTAPCVPALRKLVWDTAQRIGYAKYFLSTGSHTEDDHIPFLRVGVNALDLIDFDYPPWHTPGDTMDKLSAHSLQVVGDVLMAVWKQLEAMR